MKFTLNLTHRCNLACRYCYGGRMTRTDMSKKIARQSIEFAFSITPPYEKIEFSFFGGEPLLCHDLMQYLVALIKKMRASHRGSVRMSMTSNGTLLDRRTICLLAENDIDLCVSIDGPEHIHNQHRVYPSGIGSYKNVMSGLVLALGSLERVQVNAVYSPDTIASMSETLLFFLSENIPVVHFNPNITAKWSLGDLEKIPQAYESLADVYLDAFRNGSPVAVNLIDSKMLLFLKSGYACGDRCGMGKTEMAIAPSGNIYPCERFVGDDTRNEFILGHVESGFVEDRRYKIAGNRENSNVGCRECRIRKYCMNWCGCTNYMMTGRTDKVGQMLCVSERASVRAAQRVFTTLAGENNEAFVGLLMQYVTGECQEQVAF